MHKPTTSFNIKTTKGVIFHVVVGKGHVNFDILYGFNGVPNLYKEEPFINECYCQ
jgi:hypothetical protein